MPVVSRRPKGTSPRNIARDRSRNARDMEGKSNPSTGQVNGNTLKPTISRAAVSKTLSLKRVTFEKNLATDTDVIFQRRVRLVTDQNVLPDLPQQAEGFPMRKWSVNIYILDEDGEQHTADCFQRVVYNLHPSFENPVQTFTKAPFTCENEGWGEFEMTIDMYTTEKSKQTVAHDLNFQSNHYVSEHTITFKNPSQALQQILRETGSLPTDEDRVKRKGAAVAKKASQKYDYEKLADGLARLEESDLLHVIQMITDQRTDSMYIKTDVESGEFSIDLYSMPDKLTKDIWDHLAKKGFLT